MNLEQMTDAVRVRLGVPSGDTFYTQTVLTDLINEALQAVSSEADWPWLRESTTFTTVAGTGSYTPPADWTETISLCINGYDAMEYRTVQEIREWDTAITDVPTIYTVHGEQLLLRAIPAGAYTVQHDYVKNENTLVTPADVPLIPLQFRYSVVAFASHLAFLRSGDTQRAVSALADYNAWKARMLHQRRRTAGPVRVRVRPGGGF